MGVAKYIIKLTEEEQADGEKLMYDMNLLEASKYIQGLIKISMKY